MLKLPKHIQVNETPTSLWWMDDDGFLCVVSKAQPSEEDPKVRAERLKSFQESMTGKKVCMLMDVTNARPDKDDKKYRTKVALVFNKTVKAMAIIATSPMNKMMVNVFFDLQKPSYPFRIFDNENDARAWLSDVCSK